MFIRIFFSSKGRQRFDGIRAVFGNREEQINIRILGDCFVKKPGKESLSAKFRVGEGAAFRQGFFVGNERQTGCQTAIREITQEVCEMFFFHRIGQLDAVMAVAMVPVWVHCIKKVRATLDREHMAFLGICAAFSFLLMMFNVPLPGGTTGHAVGGALIALLLGPEAAAIAVSVALALQALLFGDGGVLSFGANCFNMAFVLPFAAAIVFRALNSRLHDKSWGTSVSAIVSGWVGLCVAALCAAIEFGIQPMLFTNASGAPLYCPFPLSVAIPAMLIPHMLVAGVVEGVATAAIYGFIKKTAPSIIVGPEAVDGQLAAEGAAAKKTSLVPTLILVAVLVVATPLGLLATGDAWGEWDAEGAATAVQEAGDDSLQASVGLDTPTFADALPTGDYLQAYSEEQGLGFAGQAAMYILSGVIGVAVLTIAFRLISLTVKESGAHGNSRAA